MLVAARGQEQEASTVPGAVLARYPLPDREPRAGIGQELERGEVRGQHGAHAERGLRVVGIDDRLRDRALHRLGERRQVGLEQMVDQHLVLRHPLLPEHPGAVGEELACGRHPERVDGVLLLRDEGGGHHVEVAGVARFEEGRPARRAGIKRIEQHVAVRIEERARVGAHLVVEHAALAPRADLGDEVGDQHRLARAGGARHDGVLGLGALGVGDAGDTSAPGCAPAESAPLPIRLHHAVQQQHALGSGIGPKLIDRRSPHASASRGMVTFVAGRRRGDFGDSSLVRMDAQSRAEIESPRARGPYTARCEYCPATGVRPDALQSKRQRFLFAYGAGNRPRCCGQTNAQEGH